jgi:hypothetical protein
MAPRSVDQQHPAFISSTTRLAVRIIQPCLPCFTSPGTAASAPASSPTMACLPKGQVAGVMYEAMNAASASRATAGSPARGECRRQPRAARPQARRPARSPPARRGRPRSRRVIPAWVLRPRAAGQEPEQTTATVLRAADVVADVVPPDVQLRDLTDAGRAYVVVEPTARGSYPTEGLERRHAVERSAGLGVHVNDVRTVASDHRECVDTRAELRQVAVLRRDHVPACRGDHVRCVAARPPPAVRPADHDRHAGSRQLLGEHQRVDAHDLAPGTLT